MHMNKICKYFLMAFILVVFTAVMSCKEKAPPATQPQIVKQKIAAQQATPAPQPSAATSAKAAPQPSAAVPSGGAQPGNSPPQADMQQKATGNSGADSGGNQTVSELIKESMAIASAYDPQGRFDPFEPLFKDQPNSESAASKGKHKKRKPQTPLERVAISQLKLSAIMRSAKGNSAIVEDATGKGYVIKKGTYIGLNSGQVVNIDKDHVVIEEELENVMGELKIQNTELKLQKPAGEL